MKDLCVNRTRNIKQPIYQSSQNPFNIQADLWKLQLFLLPHLPSITPSRSRTHSHLLPLRPHPLPSLPHQHYRRSDSLPNKLHYCRTSHKPHLNAHTTPRRPRKCQYPLHIPWDPAPRYPEHGTLRVPELQEEAEAVGATPAEEVGDAVEGGSIVLEVVGWREEGWVLAWIDRCSLYYVKAHRPAESW